MIIHSKLYLFIIALAAGFTPVVQQHHAAAGIARKAAEAAVMPQQATAQLRISLNAGTNPWPNNGVMPILAYGWGGDRPLPAGMAIDSSVVPPMGVSRPRILSVQRRKDIFSPLLQNLLDQSQGINALSIMVKPATREALNYTMWNVKVIGIRDVGKVIEENPVTEEIVFAFERLEQGGFDDGGK